MQISPVAKLYVILNLQGYSFIAYEGGNFLFHKIFIFSQILGIWHSV